VLTYGIQLYTAKRGFEVKQYSTTRQGHALLVIT